MNHRRRIAFLGAIQPITIDEEPLNLKTAAGITEPVEVHNFIAEDLQRWRLPKGGCKAYITQKASEDAFRLIKNEQRVITKAELLRILHDHVKLAVPKERDRKYNVF